MAWVTQVREFFKEVQVESTKVSWPTRNELRDSKFDGASWTQSDRDPAKLRGIAERWLPSRIRDLRYEAGLPASAAGVSAGPRPPLSVRPWQEPQSCRTRRTSSAWRAGASSSANAVPTAHANATPAHRTHALRMH